MTLVRVVGGMEGAQAQVLLTQAEPSNRPNPAPPNVHEVAVTSLTTVSYPGPDDLRGAQPAQHDGPTVTCPVCQAQVPLDA